tara:strand:+ start:55 stop:309 length:255 start_codon:yes stop_codon:yes gene_type:complete
LTKSFHIEEKGVRLSKKDLNALTLLFKYRWMASVRNWKEKGLQQCQWIVSCPNENNEWLEFRDNSLHVAVKKILRQVYDKEIPL